MFLQLSHTKLNIFRVSQEPTLECYRVTAQFPNEEEFAMIQQIKRAALSVHLNLAEGCSRKSKAERIRYFELARGSVIEMDATMEMGHKLNYAPLDKAQPLVNSIIKTLKLLSGMIS